jgi:hypothetical protein
MTTLSPTCPVRRRRQAHRSREEPATHLMTAGGRGGGREAPVLKVRWPFTVQRRFLNRGATVSWGRILGRNPDKSLKSFPPCYSQRPLLQLCLEILISSNSRNLLQFLKCVAVHVKEKGGKPDRKPHILPRNPPTNLKSYGILCCI